jgi:hypothetical protein
MQISENRKEVKQNKVRIRKRRKEGGRRLDTE